MLSQLTLPDGDGPLNFTTKLMLKYILSSFAHITVDDGTFWILSEPDDKVRRFTKTNNNSDLDLGAYENIEYII